MKKTYNEAIALHLAELNAPVAAVDRDTRLIFASKGFWDMYQAEPCGMGSPLEGCVPALRNGVLMQAVRDCLGSGRREVIEPTLSNNFVRTTIIGAEWGALLHYEDQATQLEQQRIRWEIVDGLVHAFQTPLTSITGYAETLMRPDPVDEADRRSFIERIHLQALRLARTVNDLLFLSRLDKPEFSRELKPLDARRPVLEATKAIMYAAEEKGIGMELGVCQEPVMVYGDDDLIQSAVLNLLDNAVKYSHYGGGIRLRCGTADGEAVISVSDDGIGMDETTRLRVFDKFFRGTKARTGKYLGAGLGLSIVSKVAAVHGGRVEVEGETDRGCVFRISIPLAD